MQGRGSTAVRTSLRLFKNIHRYQQSNVEDLILKEGDTTTLSHVASLYPGYKEQYLRNQLGLFGIRGATASQPMKTLSG